MMKKICLSVMLGSALLALSNNADAKIWRLNNSNGGALTPAIAADFPTATTLQQAHDNAGVSNGDTIHVEQSNTTYGSCTLTKKLTIIGAGYFLNMNPNTQVNTSYGSPVDNITMNAATCSGSTITGLSINGLVKMGASRLFLTRNYIAGAYASNTITVGSTNATSIDSLIINQNWVLCGSFGYSLAEQPGTTGNVTNLLVSNNYLSGYYGSIALAGRQSGILKNNIFTAEISVYNMYVVNNISTGGSTYTFYNSVIEYNLATAANRFSGTTAGSNNTFNAPTNIVNAAPGFITSTSTDGAFQLQNSSPAKGTGKSGDDMGMYGGSLPYVLSGIPAIPSIYALTIGTIAPGATSISVTVSTKSN